MTLNVKPCCQASKGILFRIFCIFTALGVLGCCIYDGLSKGFEIEFIVIVFVLSGLGLFFAFLYVEMDEHSIKNVFKIGSLLRFEFEALRWDQVLEAKVQPTKGEVELILKAAAKKVRYHAPEGSLCASRFNEIARLFKA